MTSLACFKSSQIGNVQVARMVANSRGRPVARSRVVRVTAYKADDAPENVKSAREWIAAWKFKQATVGSLGEAVSMAASYMEEHKDALDKKREALAAMANAKLEVTITTKKKVQFGQSLKLVGSSSEMGSWDPKAAPKMIWAEGDMWKITLYLPPGRHEFKRVAFRDNGESEWEEGGNKSVEVPAKVGGKVAVTLE